MIDTDSETPPCGRQWKNELIFPHSTQFIDSFKFQQNAMLPNVALMTFIHAYVHIVAIHRVENTHSTDMSTAFSSVTILLARKS